MLGKYKAVLALLLLIILVPLTLLMTLGLWVPTLAGIWLPLGTRIALDESPRITRKGLIIPDLRYLTPQIMQRTMNQRMAGSGFPFLASEARYALNSFLLCLRP